VRARWALLALAACGGPAGPFKTAAHAEPVQVVDLGGPTLKSLQLVTITYANDSLRATDEAFGAWVVTSDWFATVGKDYGLGPGTSLPPVELAESAPATISDLEIDAALTGWIGTGTIPPPTQEILYLLYFPAGTTITDAQSGTIGCTIAAGYHSEDLTSTPQFAYAVVPTCATGTSGTVASEVQGAASHEILEAATDPFPNGAPAFQLPSDNPWAIGSEGQELADLCFPLTTVDAAFTVSRIWSNSSAAAGGASCVPASSTAPYFDVAASPSSLSLAAGTSGTVVLTGWATAELPPWSIGFSMLQGAAGTASFDPSPRLSETTIANGGDVVLTVTAPAGTPSGSAVTLVLYSQLVSALVAGQSPQFGTQEALWPVEITVL
jgi:hypothetical protein